MPTDAQRRLIPGRLNQRMHWRVQWRRHWLLALLGFFVVMVMIGAIPGQAQALSARAGDKLLHLLAFGFMTLLCHLAIRAAPVPRALLVVAIVALLGLADESLQSLLPYRNASALDWCFDIAAAAIVSTLLAWHAHLSSTAESHAKKNQ